MPSSDINDRILDILDRLRVDLGAKAVVVSQIHPDKHRSIYLSNSTGKGANPVDYPLEHSICRHVWSMNHPLIVDDAQSHPLVRDNPILEIDGIGAYAGYPIQDEAGKVAATVCAFHDRIHYWSPTEKKAISDIAEELAVLITPPIAA